jgi:sulfate adenylyltransferase
MRVGYVASEIVKHHGIVLCALISPHRDVRQRVQALFEPNNYIEVYVATPLQVCQDRDPKGNYAKVSHGQLSQFTGISDEYEPPSNPAVVIDTTTSSVDDCVLAVLTELKRRGFIA